MSVEQLSGKNVFIAEEVNGSLDVQRAIQEFKLIAIPERCMSHVFIVEDPAKPGHRTLLAAVLNGGHVCSV